MYDEQKRLKVRWIGYVCEDPGILLWCLQPLEKCIQTRKHKNTFTIWIYSWLCRYSNKRLLFYRLGKLCEDHGYSYEWVSGQKPRLTKEGKTIVCKTDNFVPLVVPGFSTSSGSNSSSTSTSQDFVNKSSSRANWRTKPHEGGPNQPKKKTRTINKKRDDSRDAVDRLRDLPEWLEEFTDNLEDTEVHAPAHTTQDSDSERLTKVVSKLNQGSTVFILTSQKTEIPKSACEPKWYGALCRRRTCEVVLRAEEFGDMITADHKVPNELGKSRHYHRCVVVVQDLATQWILNLIRANKDFTGDGKELAKVSRAVTQAKSYLYRQFIGMWKILWRSIMESSNLNTSPIW